MTTHGTLTTAQSASWSYSGAWAAAEAAGGCKMGMLELFWDRIETSQGNFDSAQLSAITSQINDMKNLRGMKISIGLGLHYPPAWVDTLLGTVHKFKNQAGTVDAADDMVWNQAVRDLAASYVTRILDHIGVENIWTIRVTSGGLLELLYPNGSGYWAFSAAALGTGLAVGQTANPEPTWIPGTTHPGGTPGVTTWANWYLQSLVNTAVWQMDVCDAVGFNGWYEMICPGVGVHTNGLASAIAANLPTSHLLRRGVAWREIMQKMPTSRRIVFIQSGTADSSGGTSAWIPQESDKTADLSGSLADGWGSARWMAACAWQEGYKVGGENPGWPGNTAYYQGTGIYTGADSMLGHVFRIIDAVPGYWDREWFAHSRQLHDGTLAGSELYSRIASSPNTSLVVYDAPFPWTTVLDAEEGTNGATINNTTTPEMTVTIGGTSAATYANDQTHNGGLAYKYAVSASTDLCYSLIAVDPSKNHSTEEWFRISAIPTTNAMRLFTFRHASGTVMFLLLLTTGQLRLQNAATTTIATSTAVIAPNTWYKLSRHAIVDTTTTGNCEVKLHNSYGQVIEELIGTNTNLGTNPITAVTIGKSNPDATGNAPILWVDDFRSFASGSLRIHAIEAYPQPTSRLRVHLIEATQATVPSRLRIHMIEATSAATPAHLRVHMIEASAASALARLRIHMIEASLVQQDARLRIHAIEATPAESVLPDGNVESQELVTLPDDVTQISGLPVVTLTDTGPNKTFIAPATVNGTVLTFNSGGVEIVIVVQPQQWWVMNDDYEWEPAPLMDAFFEVDTYAGDIYTDTY